jgi:hypothetical protein
MILYQRLVNSPGTGPFSSPASYMDAGMYISSFDRVRLSLRISPSSHLSSTMPTWVVVHNKYFAWAAVDQAALRQSFVRYGLILNLEIFDEGLKASILFQNQVDAENMVEECVLKNFFYFNVNFFLIIGLFMGNGLEKIFVFKGWDFCGFPKRFSVKI